MKRITEAVIVDIFIVFLGIMAIYTVDLPREGWSIAVVYEENGGDIAGEVSQLFFAEPGETFSNENLAVGQISGEDLTALFELPEVNMRTVEFRLDPVSVQKDFAIQSVEIKLYGTTLVAIAGDELAAYTSSFANCEYISDGGSFIAATDDPYICFNSRMNHEVKNVATALLRDTEIPELFVFLLVAGVFIQGKTMLGMGKAGRKQRRLSKRELAAVAVGELLVCVGIAVIYTWRYLATNFARVGMTEIVYHVATSLEGTNVSTFAAAVMRGMEYVLAALLVISLCLHFLKKAEKNHIRLFARRLMAAGGVLIVFGVCEASSQLELELYIRYAMEKNTIYENYYVDGRDVTLTFPEEKRNLIYIYLESMEITYADLGNGGDMESNLIPELTAVAEDNINFSTEGLNGGYTPTGTTFTMGGMVAQTAGVPINTAILGTNYEEAGYLLPGAWTLGDILAAEGYNQVLMVGSDGSFGGRAAYFEGHGGYEIYDHDKVESLGWLPEGYLVWWGYEDEKLIEFAKLEILNLAAEEEPFNFTMLTADTHFTAGYYCELCEDVYPWQYSNVIACSSKQIAGFVEWIKEQDFYENTTIVISGDHLTMDSDYTDALMIYPDYQRKTYVAIINAPESCVETDREFSTLDLYPTTLAALGVTIEGDRLGLGVNLFSDTPTLIEEYGEEYLDVEFLRDSDLYRTLVN